MEVSFFQEDTAGLEAKEQKGLDERHSVVVDYNTPQLTVK